jgi:molybdate transport system ATP-binding protein
MTLHVSIQARVSAGFTIDVSFAAGAGITMLFGASGSGKTTLLRCLAGLRRPERGRITVGDEVLFDSDAGIDVPVQRRRVGYVFQHLALFPHLTVEQNLRFGLTHLETAEQQARVASIAESFRISHILPRRPGETSGGEQQRTALARSLVTDPQLLLLDEPLSALDYATQSRVIEDLRAWNTARGIPILYVTHSHREVFALGEHVQVIEGGRILAAGSPHQVLHAPAHESLAQLAGFENLLDAHVVSRDPDSGTMHCRLAGTDVELEVPLGHAEIGSDARLAVRAGDILLAIEPPRGISARNILPGTVRAVQREGAMVVLIVEAGARFEVHVTPRALEVLGVRVDQQVWLVIKTHSCRLVS